MSFASTGSSIQLIGTNAKCHSIGTRWVWIAACALDSTIQDAGAASPSPQTMHGGTSCAAVPRRREYRLEIPFATAGAFPVCCLQI